MFKKFLSSLSNLSRILFIYIKYQLVTKALLFILILPFYSFILRFLIKSTGRVNISSGDFLPFLFSFQGLGMLLITLILVSILVAIDINVFIVLSSLFHENREIFKVKDTIRIAFKSLKSFFNLSGVFMVLYVGLIIPLVGLEIGISPLKNFQIPNFITSVIFSTPLYLAIYLITIIVFAIIGILFIFSFHFMVICKYSLKNAFKYSFLLVKENFKSFFKDFIFWSVKKAFFTLALAIGFLFIFIVPIYYKELDVNITRFLSFFVVISSFELFQLFALAVVPFSIHRLTRLFYEYNEKRGVEVKSDYGIDVNSIRSKKKFRFSVIFVVGSSVLCVMFLNFIYSAFLTFRFDEIFKKEPNFAIVAHRSGGDLGAENTIEGLENVIKENAKFSEIDVQRTKDGKYIINHDKTFKRLCDISKSSDEMTLEEIKTLKVKNEFDENSPSQPVATLEEMLDTSKGKIGLFIELKGATADEKMVDDVVKMVKEKGMDREVVLLSLDYSLIKYIETEYPQMDSGYLYFFSIGNTHDMLGDYLIMEEREATENMIELIKEKREKSNSMDG